MNIQSVKRVSDPIFLSDLSPDFSDLEGECPQEEKAYVRVRRATEGDNIQRHELLLERRTEYRINGDVAIVESVSDNPRWEAMCNTYLTLEEIHGLLDGDKPVFEKQPVKTMLAMEYEAIWRELPIVVANVLHRAVLRFNPEWIS